MRAVTGAILILAGEQAFSHALLIGFPHQSFAWKILLPFSATAVAAGLVLLILGLSGDRKPG